MDPERPTGRHRLPRFLPLYGLRPLAAHRPVGEAAVGGNFGPALRQAGWDGIELAGAAPAPGILVIDGDRAELRDGSAYWGRDVYQCTQALKEELGAGFRVFCIGPAGENLVRFAAIANERAHFAGAHGSGRGHGRQTPEGGGCAR